jgi:hypothetical protein
VFKCFDHLPTLTTWRDQTPLGFLLRKKKERTEKKEKKKPQDFLPQYGLHIRFFKGKGRVFG